MKRLKENERIIEEGKKELMKEQEEEEWKRRGTREKEQLIHTRGHKLYLLDS